MSYGRRRIFTDETEISTENVIAEVEAAYLVHSDNRTELEKLYEYYRNKTAIEAKTKAVREDINYKIGEARCLEVTNFYKGYIFGEPIQYVRREKSQSGISDDVIAADVNALNSYMADANKAACDSKLGKWMLVGGLGYKMTLPNSTWEKDGDEPPFNVYAPDPRSNNATVVYPKDKTAIYVRNCNGVFQSSEDITCRLCEYSYWKKRCDKIYPAEQEAYEAALALGWSVVVVNPCDLGENTRKDTLNWILECIKLGTLNQDPPKLYRIN